MMKRSGHIWLLLAIVLCSVTVLASCDNTEADATPVQTEAATQAIDPNAEFTVTFDVNMPEGGKVFGDTEQTGKFGETLSTIYAEPNDYYKFVGWSDGVTSSVRSTDVFESDKNITAEFNYIGKELPILAINTEDGGEVTTRSTYKSCSVTITNTEVRYSRSSIAAEIRGRGNATWGMEKKSYRIRFAEKINPFDMASAKNRTWVLMANHCDQSMLRNYAAMVLGSYLDGIDFSTAGRFVELYFNGEYSGVYLLCEQPQVGEGRADVDDKVPVNSDGTIEQGFDITDVGYMFELDMYSEGEDYIDRFTAKGLPYTIKSEIIDKKQGEWLADFVSEAHAALKGGDYFEIAEYIDIDSALDMYIVQEYLKNIDVGWSSFYMYIPEASSDEPRVIYFGPPWDFDLAAGNDARLDNGSCEKLYVATGRPGFSQSSDWFIYLMKTDWFAELAAERWLEVSSNEAQRLIEHLSNVASDNIGSMTRNFTRWPIFGQRLNQEPESVRALNTYEDHVMYLLEWLENRRVWLDGYFTDYLMNH